MLGALILAILMIQGERLEAAPFPGADKVNLSQELAGLSTWPGYRQPSFINDITVEGTRLGIAGANQGAWVWDATTDGWARYDSPTIGSSGAQIAVSGAYGFLFDDASSPGGQWFDLTNPDGSRGTLESQNGFSLASLGDVAVSWTRSYDGTRTLVRLYQTDGLSGPVAISEWEFPASVSDLKLCRVGDALVSVAWLHPSSGPEFLEVSELAPSPTLQPTDYELPSGFISYAVTSDGRVAVLTTDSGTRLEMLMVSVSGGALTVDKISETELGSINYQTSPAIDGTLLALESGDPEGILLYDVANLSEPTAISMLPFPFEGRQGNINHLAFMESTLVFAGYRGELLRADVSAPSQPQWIDSQLVSGSIRQLLHNGPYLLADEGDSMAGRLFDLGTGSEAEELSTVLLGSSPRAWAWNGHVAYAAANGNSNELYAIDFSDPAQPKMVFRRQWSGGLITGCSTDGSTLVVAEEKKLWFFDLDTPEFPVLLSTLALSGSSQGGRDNPPTCEALVVRHGLAYVILRDAAWSLLTLDLSDSANVVEVSRADYPTSVTTNAYASLEYDNGRLWMAGSWNSASQLNYMEAFDLTDPREPAFLGLNDDFLGGGSVDSDLSAMVAGDYLLRVRQTRGDSPWGASKWTYRLQAQTIAPGLEDKLALGSVAATAWLRDWEANDGVTAGRQLTPGVSLVSKPDVIGDTILLPLGLHGFDILRADFLSPSTPTILIEPQDRLAAEGRGVTLSATVDGALPMTFQWYKGEDPVHDSDRIHGSNGLFLHIDDVIPGDAGDYVLKITNDEGNVSTGPVSLEVVEAKSLTVALQLENDNWHFAISGERGTVVGLEYSDDLEEWSSVSLNAMDDVLPLLNGGATAIPTQYLPGHPFYRAVLLYPN